MARIVQKFGGSSVANAERIFRVAKIITDAYAKGNEMCVVLSAQGDTTDDLIAKAEEINPNASKREMDMLLACGEQMSIALMAMAIEKLGLSGRVALRLAGRYEHLIDTFLCPHQKGHVRARKRRARQKAHRPCRRLPGR